MSEGVNRKRKPVWSEWVRHVHRLNFVIIFYTHEYDYNIDALYITVIIYNALSKWVPINNATNWPRQLALLYGS